MGRRLFVIAVAAPLMLAACTSGVLGPGSDVGDRAADESEDLIRLLRLIPADVRDSCEPVVQENPFIGGGDRVALQGHPLAIAGVFCRWPPSSAPEQARPVALRYLLFDDVDAMYRDYWETWVFGNALGPSCTTDRAAEFVYLRDGAPAGRLFCTGGDFQPEMTWTDDRVLVIANAMQIPYPDVGAQELVDWWMGRMDGDIELEIEPRGEGATGMCLGRPVTIEGTSGDDRLRGTADDDVIAGLRGDDVIVGLDAKDRICGGPGDDRVLGGGGNDLVSGGPGDDLLEGGGQIWDRVAYSGAAGAVHVDLARGVATGEGRDTLIGFGHLDGSVFADVLIGDDEVNWIDGGAGDDRIVGAGGWDWLLGGSGDDALSGGDGRDGLDGEDGDDSIDGGPDSDRANGMEGTDRCFAVERARSCEA